MRTLRSLATLALVFGLSTAACIVLPTRSARDGGVSPEFTEKLVVGKEPPNQLIAEDGTRCITSRERYERARIGAEVWCVWNGSGPRNPVRMSSRH